MIQTVMIIRTKILFSNFIDYGIIQNIKLNMTNADAISKFAFKLLPQVLNSIGLAVPEGIKFTFDVELTNYGASIHISDSHAKLYEMELCNIKVEEEKPKIIQLH